MREHTKTLFGNSLLSTVTLGGTRDRKRLKAECRPESQSRPDVFLYSLMHVLIKLITNNLALGFH